MLMWTIMANDSDHDCFLMPQSKIFFLDNSRKDFVLQQRKSLFKISSASATWPFLVSRGSSTACWADGRLYSLGNLEAQEATCFPFLARLLGTEELYECMRPNCFWSSVCFAGEVNTRRRPRLLQPRSQTWIIRRKRGRSFS